MHSIRDRSSTKKFVSRRYHLGNSFQQLNNHHSKHHIIASPGQSCTSSKGIDSSFGRSLPQKSDSLNRTCRRYSLMCTSDSCPCMACRFLRLRPDSNDPHILNSQAHFRGCSLYRMQGISRNQIIPLQHYQFSKFSNQ